jgi:hypothetical protein
MKFTAALLALAAAIAAPLASAQCTGANALILGNLTIASTTKRTSVNGGARIVQRFTVKNAGPNSAVVGVGAPYDPLNTLIKGTAKVSGTKAVTLSAAAATTTAPILPQRVTSGPTTGITIPAGKTLKGTIVWKAPTCVNPSPSNFVFGPATVAIFADPLNCNKQATAATVCIVFRP